MFKANSSSCRKSVTSIQARYIFVPLHWDRDLELGNWAKAITVQQLGLLVCCTFLLLFALSFASFPLSIPLISLFPFQVHVLLFFLISLLHSFNFSYYSFHSLSYPSHSFPSSFPSYNFIYRSPSYSSFTFSHSLNSHASPSHVFPVLLPFIFFFSFSQTSYILIPQLQSLKNGGRSNF